MWLSVILLISLVPRVSGQSFTSQLLNFLQLSFKRLIEQFVPSIFRSSTSANTGSGTKTLQLPFVNSRGSGALSDFMCPKCQRVSPSDLTGAWFGIYTNDNFIRNHIVRLAKYRQEGSNASVVEELMNLVTPARVPSCLRIDFGQPVEYGMFVDLPMLVSFRDGLPRGRLVQVVGRLRAYEKGELVFISDLGLAQEYVIKFCAALLIQNDKFLAGGRLRRKRSAEERNRYHSEDQMVILSKQQYKMQHEKTHSSRSNFISGSSGTAAVVKSAKFAVLPGGETPKTGTREEFLDLLLSDNNTSGPAPRDHIKIPGPATAAIQHQGRHRPIGHLVLTELSGIIACQNYLVLSRSRELFFENFDETVLTFLADQSGNSATNPLMYIGCPKNFE